MSTRLRDRGRIPRAGRARGYGRRPSELHAQEALKHCDAVVIGEVELVIGKLLSDLKQGAMRGIYKSDELHSCRERDADMPRYDLLEEQLCEPHLRSDLARLPPGLHLLRRAAHERPQIPLPSRG